MRKISHEWIKVSTLEILSIKNTEILRKIPLHNVDSSRKDSYKCLYKQGNIFRWFRDHKTDDFKVIFLFPLCNINYFHLLWLNKYGILRRTAHLKKINALKAVFQKWCGICEYEIIESIKTWKSRIRFIKTTSFSEWNILLWINRLKNSSIFRPKLDNLKKNLNSVKTGLYRGK